jgi:hypothetical protein
MQVWEGLSKISEDSLDELPPDNPGNLGKSLKRDKENLMTLP